MKAQVKEEFDLVLRSRFAEKPEILRFLLNHDRKQVCIDRLCEQIGIAERSANIGRRFEISRFKLFIRDVCLMFASAAVRAEEEKHVSQAEAARRQAEADRYKLAEEAMQDLEKEAMDQRIHSFPTPPSPHGAALYPGLEPIELEPGEPDGVCFPPRSCDELTQEEHAYGAVMRNETSAPVKKQKCLSCFDTGVVTELRESAYVRRECGCRLTPKSEVPDGIGGKKC